MANLKGLLNIVATVAAIIISCRVYVSDRLHQSCPSSFYLVFTNETVIPSTVSTDITQPGLWLRERPTKGECKKTMYCFCHSDRYFDQATPLLCHKTGKKQALLP